MTQTGQRVLEAWYHAGTQRVEVALWRHMAPVYVQWMLLADVIVGVRMNGQDPRARDAQG